jgi:hypothetical protein
MPSAIIPPLLPDVEVLLVNWLNLQTETTAALSSARMCTDLPYIPAGASGVWVRISRAAGLATSRFIDRPVVDIDAYSFDRDAAVLAARSIQNLLFWQLRGSSTPDGVVQNVIDVIGPRWIGDDNQDMSRYSASYELYTKPLRARS